MDIRYQATVDGLVIDPCTPDDWKEYSVKRNFRGTTYNIKVINKAKSNPKFNFMIVDGKKTNSNVIKAQKKKNVFIEVYLN